MKTMLFPEISLHSKIFSESGYIFGHARTEIVIIVSFMRVILFTSFIRKEGAQFHFSPPSKLIFHEQKREKRQPASPSFPSA